MFIMSEYHKTMRLRIPRSRLFLALLTLPAFLLAGASAQINGVPSSVTSPGFGGRSVNGPAPSVSSVGPRGYTPTPQARFLAPVQTPLQPPRNGDGRHMHHHQGNYAPPLLYAYPYAVPYAVDNGPADENDSADVESDYQGGPTVFDRRGSGDRSYIPPVNDAPARREAPLAEASQSDPPTAADPTLLVYKDGRKQEVGNYAIVGSTLFDLTPGHPRKIALADLDLEATRKQNDDRGIVFQVPPSLRAN
jgi:hypothetical protein